MGRTRAAAAALNTVPVHTGRGMWHVLTARRGEAAVLVILEEVILVILPLRLLVVQLKRGARRRRVAPRCQRPRIRGSVIGVWGDGEAGREADRALRRTDGGARLRYAPRVLRVDALLRKAEDQVGRVIGRFGESAELGLCCE